MKVKTVLCLDMFTFYRLTELSPHVPAICPHLSLFSGTLSFLSLAICSPSHTAFAWQLPCDLSGMTVSGLSVFMVSSSWGWALCYLDYKTGWLGYFLQFASMEESYFHTLHSVVDKFTLLSTVLLLNCTVLLLLGGWRTVTMLPE